MFVLTLSRKRALRVALVVLAIFVGIAVGIAAVLTSINTGAEETLLPIYSVDRPDNKIALTFDCAWGNSNTEELLAILEEHGVVATFFVTGDFVDRFPDDVRSFFTAGHEIGNHSDMHPRIKGMNINRLIEDTREAERKIMTITGSRPALYRSPYGEYDMNSIKTIEGMGYKFIQWSVDSIDWQEPDPATIIKRITDKTVAGSILLFHNDLENTTQALPEVLTRLKQAGFEFVTVSDLIYHDDYYIDHAGKQFREVRTLIPVRTDAFDDPALSEAIEIVLQRLTYEEIRAIRDSVAEGNSIPSHVAVRITPHLSAAQLNALSNLTAEQADAIVTAILNDKDGSPELHEIVPINENLHGTANENEHDHGEYWLEPKDGEFAEDYINIPELPDLEGLLRGGEYGLDDLPEGFEGIEGIEEILEGGTADLNELLREFDDKG